MEDSDLEEDEELDFLVECGWAFYFVDMFTDFISYRPVNEKGLLLALLNGDGPYSDAADMEHYFYRYTDNVTFYER